MGFQSKMKPTPDRDGTVVTMPFGKYLKVPAEAIPKLDPQYAEWLTLQPGVRQRWPAVYQILINNVQTSETPEHNALAALFLDPDYRVSFVEAVVPGWLDRPRRDFEATLTELRDEARTRLTQVWEG